MVWLVMSAMILQLGVGDSLRDSAAAQAVIHECDHTRPEWLFCDDFEHDQLSRYFEYSDAHGSFRRVDSTGLFGSHAMRAQFARGQTDAGSLKLALGKTPDRYLRSASGDSLAKYRELYWRLYVRTDSGWTGGGGDKLTRAQVLDSNWAQVAAAQVWSGKGRPGADYLVLDPASGVDESGTLRTTHYNDFDHLRWLGMLSSRTPMFDQAHTGEWHCVEAHVRLNDPGQNNGVFELWIDNVLEARQDGLNWLGRYSTYGLNVIFIENYWNDGSPAAQGRSIDNFVVSSARIGCAEH